MHCLFWKGEYYEGEQKTIQKCLHLLTLVKIKSEYWRGMILENWAHVTVMVMYLR